VASRAATLGLDIRGRCAAVRRKLVKLLSVATNGVCAQTSWTANAPTGVQRCLRRATRAGTSSRS
jgi:hypothetical protein